MNDYVLKLLSQIKSGVLPAMATPIRADGYRVDTDAVAPLVDFLIEAGVHGLFVGGTTGEGLLLDLDQRCALHEASVEAAAGRVPVLLHVGTNVSRDSLTLANHAAKIGVDGIVAITPTFYGMTDDALRAYFEEIAAVAAKVPFFVYDIPHMAATGVGPSLLGHLLEDIPNFGGIKSSRADAQVIRQLLDVAGDDAMLLAGNERIALASLALGAAGLISGLATAIPEPFVALVKAHAAGDLDAARREQHRINRLLDLLPMGERIGALKLILEQRGFSVGPPVPPRTMPSDPDLWRRLSAVL